jgi:hypothetical protein
LILFPLFISIPIIFELYFKIILSGNITTSIFPVEVFVF